MTAVAGMGLPGCTHKVGRRLYYLRGTHLDAEWVGTRAGAMAMALCIWVEAAKANAEHSERCVEAGDRVTQRGTIYYTHHHLHLICLIAWGLEHRSPYRMAT